MEKLVVANQLYITLTNFEKKLDKLTKYCNISNI